MYRYSYIQACSGCTRNHTLCGIMCVGSGCCAGVCSGLCLWTFVFFNPCQLFKEPWMRVQSLCTRVGRELDTIAGATRLNWFYIRTLPHKLPGPLTSKPTALSSSQRIPRIYIYRSSHNTWRYDVGQIVGGQIKLFLPRVWCDLTLWGHGF